MEARWLFRRRQDWAGLCRLLANPRAHTGAGYHYRAHGAARPGPSFATAATGAWAAAADATPQPLMDALCPSKTAVLVLAPKGGYFVPEKKKDGGGAVGGHPPRPAQSSCGGASRRSRRWTMWRSGGGDPHTYYIQFTDGSAEGAAVPAELRRALLDVDPPVEQLAFAPDGG
ncbi:hypothetical protein I4F81_006395 [Pyropia yezoensis]|uniref:Uncharacterized protein n=1 Tax=Pyropia yezoensis TaxID=2788 RepID=A0ACC3C261_PYRYE|nr:hypothetical protein I4F81_006395 [Neopyropia yezoensis]